MNERIKIAIESNVEILRETLNQLEKDLNGEYKNDMMRSRDIGYCFGLLLSLRHMIDSKLYEELNNRYNEVDELYRRKVFYED